MSRDIKFLPATHTKSLLKSALKYWGNGAELKKIQSEIERTKKRKVHFLVKKIGTDDVKIVWDRD